tara:strand:- start:212 stop:730 length:519 start_codon:yes stop_codon:yes gene_type:complete
MIGIEDSFFNKQKQMGFTLMELLMALAIVGIIAVFGIPSMTQFLASKRTDSQINEFLITIREARTSAMKLNSTVVINPINGDWTSGWQMGLDANGNGSIDSILRDSLIDSNELQFDSIPSSLSFDSRGRANPTLISITPVKCGTTNPRRDIDVTFAGYIDITRCACETVPCP